VLQCPLRVRIDKECSRFEVLPHDDLVVFVERRRVSNNRSIEVSTGELRLEFRF
jgi:hypothetical protein